MWLLRVLVLVQAFQVVDAPKPVFGYHVALDPLPEVVLLGSSCPVSYLIGNKSDHELDLGADSLGTTVGLTLVDEAGALVRQTPKFAGPRLSARDFYRLKPGEKIRLRSDLAFSYAIPQPGTYTLRLAPDQAFEEAGYGKAPADADVAQAKLSVVTYETLASQRLKGHYSPAYLGTSAPDVGPRESSARLSLVEAQGTQGPRRFLLIDEIVVMDQPRVGLPSYSFPVSPGSTIEQAEMDYFGQIWVEVKSETKMSLLLWRINDLSWSVLIDSTERKIVMETGQARGLVPDQKLVIAGIEGEELKSTYSVSPYFFGGTGKADPERGRP